MKIKIKVFFQLLFKSKIFEINKQFVAKIFEGKSYKRKTILYTIDQSTILLFFWLLNQKSIITNENQNFIEIHSFNLILNLLNNIFKQPQFTNITEFEISQDFTIKDFIEIRNQITPTNALQGNLNKYLLLYAKNNVIISLNDTIFPTIIQTFMQLNDKNNNHIISTYFPTILTSTATTSTATTSTATTSTAKTSTATTSTATLNSTTNSNVNVNVNVISNENSNATTDAKTDEEIEMESKINHYF